MWRGQASKSKGKHDPHMEELHRRLEEKLTRNDERVRQENGDQSKRRESTEVPHFILPGNEDVWLQLKEKLLRADAKAKAINPVLKDCGKNYYGEPELDDSAPHWSFD